MKISGGMSNGIHIPLSTKQDMLLISGLFIFDFFFYSSWLKLGQVATEPWLIFASLYGLATLIPLAWRNRAPVTVFAILCVLTVAAWPIMEFFLPALGIPASLFAVAAHRGKKVSRLSLLASIIPLGLEAAVGFKLYASFDLQLRWVIPNAILLLLMTVGAWVAGRATRATQQRVQHLEHERETVLDAVAAERRRIARELQDIVSDTTGKKAMAELRRLLRLLELSDPPSHATGIDELRPQPGLGGSDRATRLTTRHQNAGQRPRRGHIT